MKKSVILVGLLLMGLQMFGQYKIEGQIKNHGGRILLLVQDAIGQYDTLGNSITADGKFCFTGKVEQPIAAEIRAVNTRLCFPVFLENGNYEIDADVKQPKAYKVVGGGEMQDLRNEFRKKLASLVTTVNYGENGFIQKNTELVINDPDLALQQLNYEAQTAKIEEELGELDFTGKSLMEIIEMSAERKSIIQEKLGISPKDLIMIELFTNPNSFQATQQERRIIPEFIQQ